MMFVWIVIVDIEHWEICEHCKWLNIVLMLKEYLLNWSEISNCYTYNVHHGQIKSIWFSCRDIHNTAMV